jgi:hypothetical protein
LYVTGDLGTLLRFNGATWQAQATGTTDLLWAVSGAPNGGGGAFAVGYNGTIVTGSSANPLMMAATTAGSTRGSLEPSAAAGARGAGRAVPDGRLRRMRKAVLRR